MNYKTHYDNLIKRAVSRTTTGYTERHHIIPRCMGGNNIKSNLVRLTPEEHYVAHQLLIKIYPGSRSLIHAAMMMSYNSTNQRRHNKGYGWIKRLYVKECRQRLGENNPSYGRRWYYNPETSESGKFADGMVPDGWVKGRIIGCRKNQQRSPVMQLFCHRCGNIIEDKINARYCVKCRRQATADNAIDRFNSKKEEFLDNILSGYSFDIALKMVGYKSYTLKSGAGKLAQELLILHGIDRPSSPKRPPKASA